MSSSISLRCKPGSKAPGFAVEDGALLLRVRERALEGAANAACIRELAKALRVPPSAVTLVSGTRSAHKRFAVEGLDEREARLRLGLGV